MNTSSVNIPASGNAAELPRPLSSVADLQPWSHPAFKMSDALQAETGTFSNADGDTTAS
ncbi:MAG: hypothetical protein JSR60_15390 [Proteobacteria bacterium]|nr:hypothetical protein [Pseudomonadota bacterium]